MVPFVCIVKSMFSEEYIVPEEQRLEKKRERELSWLSSCTSPQKYRT